MLLSKTFPSHLLEHSLWWQLVSSETDDAITVSKKLETLLGKKVTDIETFLMCLLPESRTLLMNQLASIRQKGAAGERFLVGVAQPDHPLWLTHELHLNKQQAHPVITAICNDLTDIAELTANSTEFQKYQPPKDATRNEASLLQQQFQNQTQFLAMLSHELRSPLMGLNSMLNIVKQKLSGAQNEKVAEELKVMKMTIDQMNFLINDILTYAQTEFNQIRLNPTVFDLHEMADYVCHLTKSIASENGIDVHFSVTTQNDCFYGDLVRLSQVLVNLIVNAIKFTQQGGVEVMINEEDEFIEFHVADSGEGIDESELASIFTPFKQLDSKGGEQYVGSGLGLSIVKTLVDLMGGILEVKSKRGEGTDFSFVIPMRSGGCPDSALPQSQPQPLPGLSHINSCEFEILVADDSVINRKVMQAFLEELGCHVDQAEDGTQAWQKFQQKPYDFVFLDIQMPGLNGMEVCQKMRQLPQQQTHSLKGIFALTAPHTEAEVLGAGTSIDKSLFDAWLEKPASQDKIIHLLHCQSYSDTDSVSSSEGGQSEKESSEVMTNPSKNMPEGLVSLMPQLKENVDQDLADFESARAHNDLSKGQAALHRLKGNLMLFELTDAVDLVRLLESLKTYDDAEKINKKLKRLEKKLNDIYKVYL